MRFMSYECTSGDYRETTPYDEAFYYVVGGNYTDPWHNLDKLPTIQMYPTDGARYGQWKNILDAVDIDDPRPAVDTGEKSPWQEAEEEFYDHYTEILLGKYSGDFRLVGFAAHPGQIDLYFHSPSRGDILPQSLSLSTASRSLRPDDPFHRWGFNVTFELPPNMFGFRSTYTVFSTTREHSFVKVIEDQGFVKREIEITWTEGKRYEEPGLEHFFVNEYVCL